MNPIRHIDLFSGIGGFSIAVEAVWPNSEHIFCEIDPYCQALLKKRFERSVIVDDIRKFTADAIRMRKLQPQGVEQDKREWNRYDIDLLTAGVPCQPASIAGNRRGEEDDRWLWSEAFRVIRETKPEWVILENPRGLLTLKQGVVFEKLLVEMESYSYEIQPIIIPACAVNAPHQRYRVWIVAHAGYRNGQGIENNREPEGQISCQEDASKPKRSNSDDGKRFNSHSSGKRPNTGERDREERQILSDENRDAQENQSERDRRKRGVRKIPAIITNSETERFSKPGFKPEEQTSSAKFRDKYYDWTNRWLEVATRFCGVDDGLSARVDGLELSKSRHRIERLKGLGNAIVPQVAIEIFKAIISSEKEIL